VSRKIPIWHGRRRNEALSLAPFIALRPRWTNKLSWSAALSSSEAEPQSRQRSGLVPVAARCYGTFQEMITTEARLPEGERMDFVAIVTPNHVHFPRLRWP